MDQWAEDLEKQITGGEEGQDLSTVNIQMQRQQLIETEMLKRSREVTQLQEMEVQLEELEPERIEEIRAHRIAVQEK